MNLFLFAHQDDEYGVYPVLEELVGRGETVKVIYLTSGTLDGSRCERRNHESMRVLSRIGVATSQVRFLGTESGFPDGRLCEYAEQAAAELRQICARGESPTRIFSPAWEGGHQDHDATYIIACYLAGVFSCTDASRQFPLYTGQGLPASLWHTFYPLADNGPVETSRMNWRQRLRYLGYCLSYHSQWRTWLGLYPMYALHILVHGKQYLQPLNPQRVCSAPHPGRCLYERRGFCTREQFVYHTRALVDKITH